MNNEFKLKFNLPQNGFLEPVDLQDTQIGFSVYKNREQVGFKSLFRVYINDKDINNAEINLKPITISASYGKENENGITISSSEFERGRDWPIELISEGDFFYDTETGNFLDRKNKTVTGIDILNLIDKQHLKPTKLISGFSIRTKLFLFQTLFAKILHLIFDIFSTIQYLISGEKIHIFDQLTEPKYRTKAPLPGNLSITKGKTIKIFEYEVEAWVAMLYCSFHITFYLLLYFIEYKPKWLTTIFTNNFLTTMYVIISLGVANTLLPNILKSNKFFNPLLLFIQKIYFKCIFKKFKI